MIYHIRLHVLCLIATLCFATWAQAEYSTLVLQARRRVGWEERYTKQVSGMLVRELARQSLLIARLAHHPLARPRPVSLG